jgi:hypothetical protein
LHANGNKSLKELIKKDNEALSLIGSAIDESNISKNECHESSKEAWDILKNTYEGATTTKL